MSTETKFGLILILVLLGALGFVVYKKWEKTQAQLATITAEADEPADQQPTDPFGQPIEAAPQQKPTAAQGAEDFDAIAAAQSAPPAQHEPAADPFPQGDQGWPAEPNQQQIAQTPPAQGEPAADPFAQPGAADPQASAQQPPFAQATPAVDAAATAQVTQQHTAKPPADDPFGTEWEAETAAPAQQAPPEEDLDDLFAKEANAQAPPAAQTHAPPIDESHLPQEVQQQAPVAIDAFAPAQVARPEATPQWSEPARLDHGQAQPANMNAIEQVWGQTAGGGRSFGSAQKPFQGDQPSGNDSVTIYVVRANDNFWNISREVYGTPRYFAGLARYNGHRISDVQKMRPGMKVLVPAVAVLKTRYPDLYPQRPAQGATEEAGFFRDASGRPAYRVGRNDTLSSIAQKHLGRSSRWIQIFHMNRGQLASPNNLKVGTVLSLPTDASQIRLAGAETEAELEMEVE